MNPPQLENFIILLEPFSLPFQSHCLLNSPYFFPHPWRGIVIKYNHLNLVLNSVINYIHNVV